MTTKKFIFSGTVQGVGFRYFTKKFARKLKLTGWVRNNDDETVTLVAQGEEKNIEALLNYLKLFFKGKIENIEERETNLEETFKTFEIRK